MTRLLLLLTVLFCMNTLNSCSKKATCPAYDENQKEDYKIKKSKRKKAKMF